MVELTDPSSRRDARLLFCVTFVAAVLAFLGKVVAYDLWWHLKAGRLIMAGGGVPSADPFSFTAAGRPWTYHSWLSGVALSVLWQAGGEAGLVLFRAIMMAGSLMVAWKAARGRGVGAGLASVLVLAACLQLRVRALARPHLFSFVFFAVFALVLQRTRAARADMSGQGRRRNGFFAAEDEFLWGRDGRLLVLPFLMVLWANLHAGFASGLLLIGAYGAGEMVRLALGREGRSYLPLLWRGRQGARFRALLVTGVLCLAGSVVTPNGPGTLLYPFRLLSGVKLVRRIQEWLPMPFTGTFSIFWVLLFVSAAVLARSFYFGAKGGRGGRQMGQWTTDTLLMAGFAFLALRGVRHMAWFLLLTPAVVGHHLTAGRRTLPGVESRSRFRWMAFLLAAVVGIVPRVHGGMGLGVDRTKVPVQACDFMQENGLYDRLYNSYEWGGYLIWRLWPEVRVFVDGRCLVYGDRILAQALRVEDGEEGWEEVFDRWDVEMFLVRYRRKDSKHLFAEGRWRCVYWDDMAVIGLRDDVLRRRRPGLATFDLSNPAAFEDGFDPARAEAVLKELEAVLARDPKCWTALGFEARCLAGLAERDPARRDELLRGALLLARKAVELQEKHWQPWEALAQVAKASGKRQLAREAERMAAKYRPKKSGD